MSNDVEGHVALHVHVVRGVNGHGLEGRKEVKAFPTSRLLVGDPSSGIDFNAAKYIVFGLPGFCLTRGKHSFSFPSNPNTQIKLTTWVGLLPLKSSI